MKEIKTCADLDFSIFNDNNSNNEISKNFKNKDENIWELDNRKNFINNFLNNDTQFNLSQKDYDIKYNHNQYILNLFDHKIYDENKLNSIKNVPNNYLISYLKNKFVTNSNRNKQYNKQKSNIIFKNFKKNLNEIKLKKKINIKELFNINLEEYKRLISHINKRDHISQNKKKFNNN